VPCKPLGLGDSGAGYRVLVTIAQPIVLDGRYVLGDVLGRGGMAQVFRARDTVLDRAVAIKVFHQEGVLPDGDVRRGGEVRLLAGLHHPGLVMVYDAGRDESNPLAPFAYLVMELVEGTTLARQLDSGPLPAQRAAAVGAQLAGALAYVHARGVVHRDIKPANVLISGDVAKLTDFGVARLVDSTRLTLDGTTLGTANYLSPEQTTGADVAASSDVYSFGLVLLECLTGEVAYPGTGVAAAVARLHRQPTVPDWLDPAWRDLITAMTASDPADRPDAPTVAARLQLLAMPVRPDHEPTVAFTPLAKPTRSRGARRRVLPWIAAAVAAALAGGGIAVATTTGGSGPAPVAYHYPVVTGRLGTDLHTLESVVPDELADDVLAVARRCVVSDYQGAQRALSTLLDDLAGLHRRNAIDSSHDAAIANALGLVSADVTRGQQAVASARNAAIARAAARKSAAAKAELAAKQAAAKARAQAKARAAAKARAKARAEARQAAAREAARRAAARARHHHEWWHGHGHGHGHGDWNGQGGD
jgi:eukaryotic-like serine/threonine-protein kinase